MSVPTPAFSEQEVAQDHSSAPREPRGRRGLTVAIALLLVLGSLAAYQVGVRSRRPPSFRRGGRFVEAGSPSAANVPGLSSSPGAPAGTASTLPAATGAAGTPSATDTGHGATTANHRATVGAGAEQGTTAVNPPALGTYTWNVSGTEAATGFGDRSFPDTMTMVAHRDSGLTAGQVTLDLTYSSNHTEREILDYGPGGIGMIFEGGQVRFGPTAQSNQGDYVPPMTQVPFPLVAGATVSGRTFVKAADGSTERIEDWTTQVIDQESVVIGGQPVSTWKIISNRQTEPGASQIDNRSLTYWYDPVRRLWVKYTEKLHGQQSHAGFTFTYDENLVATLASFSPA